ncbi:hypothetical protein [Methylomonas rosea]|uniref:Peptidase n=1 Tax=Methylomonas rosea TaxID=2952227 RepID=A0ABT1TXQ1_9GAMM|nr:hypothetical protein [Methylomonas sp. WSC-7]MCQ8119554.1 hypothetical protein [Methylomonas sp. WSC-7]
MKKTISTLFTSALLVVSLVGAAGAATKQVQFAKGKSGTTISGTVKGGEDIDHVLRASAGQTLNVDFKAGKGAAFFNVVPPGSTSEALFVGMNEGNHYSGTLPKDGDYIIRVYLKGGAKDTGKPVKYTLKVGIPASGKTGGAAGKVSETGVAEKACLDAVAKQVGKDKSLLKVSDVFSSEAGMAIMVQVPDATAPWKCFSDKKGKVSGVEFTGSEGAL